MGAPKNRSGYPWEDSDGLSPILRDIRLWQGVFGGLDYSMQCFVGQKLKDSARTAGIYKRKQTRSARQQDRDIAEDFCDVLSNSKARHTFARALDLSLPEASFRFFIADMLHKHLHGTFRSRCPEFVPGLCDERQPDRWFLNSEKC